MLTFDEKGGPEDCPKTAKTQLRIIWMFQWHSTICSTRLLIGMTFDLQSCAYYFGYSLFQDSEETIYCTKIKTTSHEPPWDFSLRKKKFEQPNNQKLKTKELN